MNDLEKMFKALFKRGDYRAIDLAFAHLDLASVQSPQCQLYYLRSLIDQGQVGMAFKADN